MLCFGEVSTIADTGAAGGAAGTADGTASGAVRTADGTAGGAVRTVEKGGKRGGENNGGRRCGWVAIHRSPGCGMTDSM